MDLATEFDFLLQRYAVQPVLVDVGASGGSPDIWRPIARHSTYIGFDPDLREVKRDTVDGYKAGVVINKAISENPSATSVTFYLTESPYCSSTLEPDEEALSAYSFWKLFGVRRMVTVPATTLSRVVLEEGLSSIDWLKIDSQGTDLRIYRSIDDPLRNRIIAVDTEPGLLDAYRDEDLFVDVHRYLKSEGFWLSNLNVMGAQRISKSAMDALGVDPAGDPPGLTADQLRISPGWCEARYIRTTTWLRDTAAREREYIVSWIFSVLDRQYGHALDVAQTIREVLPATPLGARLWEQATQLLQTHPLSTPNGRGGASSGGLEVSRLRRIVRKALRLR